MKPTDTENPDYYHRLVDCQWACPAHTDVPEYIRLIAQGKCTESYLLNRESNVFPGNSGRACDRLHDGTRVKLNKIEEHYDPTDPVKAHAYIHEHQLRGEIVTGLLYINEEVEDMHDLAGTTETPLVEIPFENLNPGSDAVRKFQESLR
jgi:hypothetical protein